MEKLKEILKALKIDWTTSALGIGALALAALSSEDVTRLWGLKVETWGLILLGVSSILGAQTTAVQAIMNIAKGVKK